VRPLSRRIASILLFPDSSIDELMESAGLLAWCALVGIIACVVIDGMGWTESPLRKSRGR